MPLRVVRTMLTPEAETFLREVQTYTAVEKLEALALYLIKNKNKQNK